MDLPFKGKPDPDLLGEAMRDALADRAEKHRQDIAQAILPLLAAVTRAQQDGFEVEYATANNGLGAQVLTKLRLLKVYGARGEK